MFSISKALYQKHIGKSIFSKNMLIYAAISILPILLLTFIITNNIGDLLQKKEISQNDIIIYNIGNYFEQKYQSVYSIIQQTYMDTKALPDISDFLESEIDISDSRYPDYYKKFTSYFYSFFSRDNDLHNVVVYKGLDRKLYIISKNFERVIDDKDMNFNDISQLLMEKAPKIKIYPAHVPEYNAGNLVYTLSINIKVLGTNDNSGILLLDFKPEGIGEALSKLNYNTGSGSVYILTASGDVIYDSSNKYYNKKYPYIDLLNKNVHSAIIDGEECIINSRTQANSGVIVASVMPKKAILKDVININRTVFFITFLCIITALIFTRVSASYFSKRIISITRAMKKVRDGDLSVRIGDNGPGDEIGDISYNFDMMCDNLNEYINKVYLLEIKQKNIELSALQAQINPHFLYNTLEAIRMKAESAREEDISNMIYILANLFRNMIKGNTIVSIKEEIEFCKSYLQLFKIRYGDKMSYEFSMNENVLEFGIIKHLLQPVIENYIIHGFDLRKGNNRITITAYKDNDDIYFEIADNGIGIKKQELDILRKDFERFNKTDKSSIGLRNVNERIKLIYGLKYGIDIHSQENMGTTVTLKISAKTRMELIACVQDINR